MTRRATRQRGAVLIVSLVVLLILTILGVSGMTTTVMQERMAGNLQEALSAFQAAESGLRDGEEDIRANITAASVFNTACANGLCEPAQTGYDVWQSTTQVFWDDINIANDRGTRAFGSQTGTAPLHNVSRQPAYVIERLSVVERGGSIVTGFTSQPPSEWYRVTSKGFGRSGQSKVLVQSVVRQ